MCDPDAESCEGECLIGFLLLLEYGNVCIDPYFAMLECIAGLDCLDALECNEGGPNCLCQAEVDAYETCDA